MTDMGSLDGSATTADPHARRNIIVGVLAGGGMFVGIMLLLAATAIAFGMFRHDETGRLSLGPWLVLEIVGGAFASLLAGVISRRIARTYRAPAFLAACLFTFSLLEAVEILRYVSAGLVVAPTWLVLIAPIVTAVCVLLGGQVPGTGLHDFSKGHRRAFRTEAWRYAFPLVVFVAAAALSLIVLPGIAIGAPATVLATALTLDFTVVVPGLVFLLLVRARRAPWLLVIPAFVAGYAVAVGTIPSQHQSLLNVLGLLIIPAELCLVIYLIILTRSAMTRAACGDGDFATRLRSATRNVLGNRVAADILTTEISILYYAFGWRRALPETPGHFTVHRDIGYLSIMVGLIMVLFVETFSVHLLVSQWSVFAAWILTGLSIYACVWLLGDYRAMTARPLRVTPTHLFLRVGMRWEADIPRDQIQQVEPCTAPNETPKRTTLVASLLGQANFRLRLNAPFEVIGMYGISRTVQEIWLTVDRPAELCKALGRQGASEDPRRELTG